MCENEDLKMFGISRVDNNKGHYWFVRLGFKNGLALKQKIFSDLTNGGIVSSFEAAVKWRNENFIERKAISYLDYPNYEKGGSIDKKLKWREIKKQRNLAAIKKVGNGIIYVGTGIEGAKKARALGASQGTCWKIKTGQSDSYKPNGAQIPGYHLSCKGRKTGRKPDIEKQKEIGKKVVTLGVGRDAAVKALEMGMSHGVALTLFRGQKDFIKCCHYIPYFEVNGFKRQITKEIIDEVTKIATKYSYNNHQDVIQEVLINYASRTDIPDDKDFIEHLTFKYIKVLKLQANKKRKEDTLNISGDLDYCDGEYGGMLNIDEYASELYSND